MVAEQSRHLLMVRHPATGRLLWCRSLPFGYRLSPLIFCDVTESVAQIFRRRLAGRGVFRRATLGASLLSPICGYHCERDDAPHRGDGAGHRRHLRVDGGFLFTEDAVTL